MISFRLTFVLCALVFGQTLASSIQTSTAVESKDIDFLIKIVDTLEKLGDKALDIATRVVDYLLKNVRDLPNKISCKVEEILKAVEKDAREVAELMKKHTNKDATVVVTCAEAWGQKAVIDYVGTTKDVLECVKPNTEKILVIIPDLLKQLGVVLKNVEGHTCNLNKCTGGTLKELACVVDIAKKSLDEAKCLPQVLKDAYHKLKAAITDLISDCKGCLHGVLDKTLNNSLTRFNNFGSCIRRDCKK